MVKNQEAAGRSAQTKETSAERDHRTDLVSTFLPLPACQITQKGGRVLDRAVLEHCLHSGKASPAEVLQRGGFRSTWCCSAIVPRLTEGTKVGKIWKDMMHCMSCTRLLGEANA